MKSQHMLYYFFLLCQVGDRVVYLKDGHEEFVESCKSTTPPMDSWARDSTHRTGKQAFEQHSDLRAAETCIVKSALLQSFF